MQEIISQLDKATAELPDSELALVVAVLLCAWSEAPTAASFSDDHVFQWLLELFRCDLNETRGERREGREREGGILIHFSLSLCIFRSSLVSVLRS